MTCLLGLPMYGTGYGLVKPDKSMGFLKMDITLQLKESFALTFLRNPWNFAPRDPEPILVVTTSCYAMLCCADDDDGDGDGDSSY